MLNVCVLEVAHAKSYYEALNIIGEYVNITSIDDVDEDIDEGMDMKYD